MSMDGNDEQSVLIIINTCCFPDFSGAAQIPRLKLELHRGHSYSSASADNQTVLFWFILIWFRNVNITARKLVPSSVNGDIAIQWEWSNFDPSQNPNPLTDYDKTLHNWLRPRDEHVTQNLCQSAVRERLPKYVKYKAPLYLYFNFFPGLAYWSDPCMYFGAQWLKVRAVM